MSPTGMYKIKKNQTGILCFLQEHFSHAFPFQGKHFVTSDHEFLSLEQTCTVLYLTNTFSFNACLSSYLGCVVHVSLSWGFEL